MPTIKRFTVTESRSVQVEANRLEDAMRLAEHAFNQGQVGMSVNKTTMDNPPWGNTVSKVEVTHRSVEKAE